jgi:hypothetical protein
MTFRNFATAGLARFPLGWNHPSDKKSRKSKKLEQVPQKSVNFCGTCSKRAAQRPSDDSSALRQ